VKDRARKPTAGRENKTHYLALLFQVSVLCCVHAQEFTTDQLARRAVERRAVEAVNWGMPTVNPDLMLQAMIKAGGATNQIAIWAGLPDWKNQTLTPNPDTIYLIPFINTEEYRADRDGDCARRR
jgi:hypothetical protein